MKTLYIHIGTPKTGSTAIQFFCTENREILKKKGYCYPDFPYRYKGKSKRRNGVFLVGKYRDENGEWRVEEEEKIFSEGMSKIKELFKSFDNVILSDEGIWLATKSRKKELWKKLQKEAKSNDFEIKIIVYLRRQDEYAESNWNQRIKHDIIGDNTMTWEEYIAHPSRYVNIEYFNSLQKIAKVFGEENVIVKRFDRRYFTDGMIQSDFLESVGLKMSDEYKVETEYQNTKLSLNECEIKRVINGIPDITIQEMGYFETVLKQYYTVSEKAYHSDLFSKEERSAYMEKYREDNDKIVAGFIHDDQPLFREEYKEVEKWKKDNPYMLDDVIRLAASSDIALLQKVEEQNAVIKEQNARIAMLTKEVNALCGFRDKLKHPLKAIGRIIRRKFSKK